VIPEQHLEFLHAVWTRRTPYTYFFFGFNIFIFILMALAGGSTNNLTLMGFGVKSNAEIAQGQWWRFVTPMFLHIGLLHLIFNSYALWIVGPQVEKLYGGARFAILYVLTGVAGVAASYHFRPDGLSAGASGAIFGLFGVLLVFGIRHRNEIPPFFKRAVGTGVLPVIILNLVIGFSVGVVDNSAHIGGLLAGAALAAIVPFQRPGTDEHPLFTALQVSIMSLIAVCFFAVWKNYDGPNLSVRNLPRGFAQILPVGSDSRNDLVQAINNAQTTFSSSTEDLKAGRLDSIPAIKKDVEKSINELRQLPPLDAAGDRLTEDLLRVMRDQNQLVQEVQRAGTTTFATSRQLDENVDRYNDWMMRFYKWVETNGSRYGIEPDRKDH
jgi:rhomboid protease GluP